VVVRRPVPALLALALLAGCSSASEGPGQVRIQVGPQDMDLRATQGCVDGERTRYETKPPVLEVSPDATITLTVPDAIAEQGWSVQVYDERLDEQLGEVEVPDGEARFAGINTSDVVPPAFYLVVVEDKGGDCGEWSGAWPVGFLRAGGDLGTTTSPSPAG
jgi:Protein of unknown function (DUF2771)